MVRGALDCEYSVYGDPTLLSRVWPDAGWAHYDVVARYHEERADPPEDISLAVLACAANNSPEEARDMIQSALPSIDAKMVLRLCAEMAPKDKEIGEMAGWARGERDFYHMIANMK
jgi:hypothetical protein